jgi:dolichol kinase
VSRPYRDGAILYGVLAALVVVVAALSGGDVVLAVILAAAAFVGAMAWTVWRTKARGRRQP